MALVLVTPSEPLDKTFHKKIVRELTLVMSNKWLQEGELSPEAIQICTPYVTIRCLSKGPPRRPSITLR
jgi:hypothetical protein